MRRENRRRQICSFPLSGTPLRGQGLGFPVICNAVICYLSEAERYFAPGKPPEANLFFPLKRNSVPRSGSGFPSHLQICHLFSERSGSVLRATLALLRSKSGAGSKGGSPWPVKRDAAVPRQRLGIQPARLPSETDCKYKREKSEASGKKSRLKE